MRTKGKSRAIEILDSDVLVEAKNKAEKLNLDSDFIKILEDEIARRSSSKTVKK